MSKTYKYTLQDDLILHLPELAGVFFRNKFCVIRDCILIIKKGYSWDGCTFAIDTKETYIASCIHDLLYQFRIVSRKLADAIFYRLLQIYTFKYAKIYYIGVRWFGWIKY